MKEKRSMRFQAARVLVWFLAVMCLFTVVSRVTASFTVARVVVENPSARKISHVVTADGVVEKNQESAVVCEQGLLVKTVYVTVGQRVAAGEVLAQIDPDQLAEAMDLVREEIHSLELANQDAAAAQKKNEQDAARALARARQDYEQTAAAADVAVERAAEKLQSAKDAYYGFEDTIRAGAEYENIYVELAAREEAMKAAQAAYDDAVRERDTAKENAARAVEDAGAPLPADHSAEIGKIQIGQKQRVLERMQKLAGDGGKIVAPMESVVTGIAVETGQKTGDTAVVTLADLSSGMRYTARIAKPDARYVSAGDEVTLSKNGKKVSGFSVDTVKSCEDGSLEVSVLLDDPSFSIGETATLEIRRQQAVSQTTISRNALYQDNASYYVYVLDKKDTVLGEQYFVRRVDVAVEDKNAGYAALEDGELSADTMIVSDCDRYIEAGSRVRLQKP